MRRPDEGGARGRPEARGYRRPAPPAIGPRGRASEASAASSAPPILLPTTWRPGGRGGSSEAPRPEAWPPDVRSPKAFLCLPLLDEEGGVVMWFLKRYLIRSF